MEFLGHGTREGVGEGIVIDARLRVALAGVDLVGIDARVLVASLETYRKYEEVNFLERLLRV